MLPQRPQELFFQMVEASLEAPALDRKTALAAGLAAAMAKGCPACIQHFTALGQEAGLGPDQLGAVACIAMSVAAGAVRNMALEALGETAKEGDG